MCDYFLAKSSCNNFGADLTYSNYQRLLAGVKKVLRLNNCQSSWHIP